MNHFCPIADLSIAGEAGARKIVITAASAILWTAVIAMLWSGGANLIAAWHNTVQPQTTPDEPKVTADPPRIAQLKFMLRLRSLEAPGPSAATIAIIRNLKRPIH